MSEDTGAEDTEESPTVRERVGGWLAAHRTALRRGAVVVVSVMLAVAIVVGLATVVGPVLATVYVLLFGLGIALVPLTVMMLGNSTPNSLGSGLFILGQMTFGAGWLVQRAGGWQMCPGRDTEAGHQVLIDDEWRHVDTTHQTRLGWAPFGILWEKQADTLGDCRAEGEQDNQQQELTQADRESIKAVADTTNLDEADLLPSVSDGGGVERGGVTEVRQTQATEGRPWVIDLKSWWSRGLDRLGEIDPVSKVEQVTMRAEANSEDNTRRNTWIGSILGLVLGAMTGYVVMGGGL
jgi:hypothetical protein